MSNAVNSTAKWYLITSKPRDERRAFDNLAGQGIEVFYPKISAVKKRQGKKSVTIEPLFPNYLFVKLDSELANFNAIRSTRGVASFVRFGAEMATVNEQLIEKLKQDTEITGNPEQLPTLAELEDYNRGDALIVTSGPFKGLSAIYKASDGLERSIILLNMLGQQNEVVVSNQDFDKKD
ncbi:transcription/translation regulatory transformer protein RfaH [Thalassotalea mangrovi]|uniref:Transcription/translation regulatory transformer protein RfaH n=1 Tax=Thalassotalea mangrovi TaxID=2572245 RepID=A0A4U1B6I5_9GAMM|nr:transcription/translation regulatory transformer protein RfaH [Thalassotalea mangrovi]TKB46154.1 transcription/translation regulatory transformer protein RfaH [Thalassotalea mangrovi]